MWCVTRVCVCVCVCVCVLGKSDPYCRLGILQEAHMNKSVVKEKDLEVWQKEGLVVEIKATSIKKATLEPEWNEEIEL